MNEAGGGRINSHPPKTSRYCTALCVGAPDIRTNTQKLYSGSCEHIFPDVF
jgi:hypothetical protein